MGKKVVIRYRLFDIRADEVSWKEQEPIVRKKMAAVPEIANPLRLGIELRLEFTDLNGDKIGTISLDSSDL